ncbi:hypothetical protein [Microbacterium kyungheense]|uniref:Uncharacterized protein n=1 Tax=Microbacterium kyungheense TaxID=1263636 RepID=A0A543EU69_9MICO|nr:hypothetical protein [Microbacterium kyungheense]TQM25123.1 hypothetical protein FB391_2582 [Microbacterium kyungheense]
MNARSDRRNPYAIALVVVGGVALVVALSLGLAGAGEASPYTGDPIAAAALDAWSNFLLLVGAVALIGALVLAGARWLLRSTTMKVDASS